MTKNASSDQSKSRQYTPWIVAILSIVVAIIEFFVIWKGVNPKLVELNLTDTSGKGSIRLKVQAQEVNVDQILGRIFKEPDSTVALGVVEWLRKKKQMYALMDERFVKAINTDLCSSLPESSSKEYLKKARECADEPAVSELRKLAKRHLPPFQHVALPALLGIPENPDNQPSPDHANVCKDSEFLGNTLMVMVNENNSEDAISVQATGFYECVSGFTHPDLQISTQAARKLFKRPTEKYERVLVVPKD